MAAARSFDEKRARIQLLATGAAKPQEARAELKKYLADKVGYLVMQAADAVQKLELVELIPDLSAAFMRFLENPTKTDRGCLVKNHLVEVLIALDAPATDVYSIGLRLVQLEYSFEHEDPVDVAGTLRGLCAHALVHINHPGAVFEIIPLLFDGQEITRASAAAALGESGLDAAAAALHVKALEGDEAPDVIGAAYKGLLRILPYRYTKIVAAALLNEDEGVAEAAALALGETRVEGALDALKKGFAAHAGRRAAEGIALGIALLRTDAANDYLLSLVKEAPEAQAATALSALALHRHDQALVARVSVVVASRRSKELAEVFAERFTLQQP